MKRIGLLSDTHGWLDPRIREHFAQCDEVWHAGDIGGLHVADELGKWIPQGGMLRAVCGNIDDAQARATFPEHQRFTVEGVRVWITHIGGRPPGYDRHVIQELRTLGQVSDPGGEEADLRRTLGRVSNPGGEEAGLRRTFGRVSDPSGREAGLRPAGPLVFICGHSHLCMVKYDERLKLLYMNPGACGRHGFHHVRTILRFTIDGQQLKDLEVIELGPRGKLQ